MNVSRHACLAQRAAAVDGWADDVLPDDPAELYHEASALYATQLARQFPGLAGAFAARRAPAAATERDAHVPAIALPPARLPATPLADVIARRRSTAPVAGTVTVADVAALLRAAYGCTGDGDAADARDTLRAAPSAGALFPLEIHVLVFNCTGVAAGRYRYDPPRDVLERLGGDAGRSAFGRTLLAPAAARTCAVAFVVGAAFGRSRDVYGQRAYRYTLLEAGHVVQNLLLAAEALELAAVPIGGFFDRRLAELLAVDPVTEPALYVVPAGRRR